MNEAIIILCLLVAIAIIIPIILWLFFSRSLNVKKLIQIYVICYGGKQ